jgi:hypothetical protein
MNKISEKFSKILLSGLMVILTSCSANTTNEFLQQPNLKVKYSRDSRDKAKKYARLLSAALNYYDSTLTPDQDIYTLYVLSSEDYKQIKNERHVPYGMPHMSGNNIYMPAKKGIVYEQLIRSFLSQDTLLSEEKKQKRTKLAETGLDLISLHELGHTCQARLDLWQNERWKNECLANYYMLLFLKNRDPEKYRQMVRFCSLNCRLITPAWKTLEKFEEKYDSDPATYSWFQSKFTLMVNNYLKNNDPVIVSTKESISFTDYIKNRWEKQVLQQL